MFHYCLSRTSNPFKVPQCPICKVCYPSTSQTLTNPANPPSPPNPTRHHLKNPAAHPLAPHHHPTRSTIQSTQPLPPPLSPQLTTSPTQKHLSSTSTTPTNQTLPPPQKPFLFTPHHLYLTLLLQHLLHLKPPSALTLNANPYSHQLLHLLHTRLHPALNTFPSLTSTSLLNLLLCPNFTPRFRPFYLTSTHKHTTIKPQSNHPKPPTFLSLREIFLRFRTVGFIPSSRLVSRKIWRNLQRI